MSETVFIYLLLSDYQRWKPREIYPVSWCKHCGYLNCQSSGSLGIFLHLSSSWQTYEFRREKIYCTSLDLYLVSQIFGIDNIGSLVYILVANTCISYSMMAILSTHILICFEISLQDILLLFNLMHGLSLWSVLASLCLRSALNECF